MKKLVFFSLLSLLTLVGCEKRYERTIWVNPDVKCCGVEDPINNLEWLTQTTYFKEYKTASYSFSNCILLFKNDTTYEDFVVFNIKDRTNYIIIYDCNGNTLDGGAYHYINKNVSNNINATPPAPCVICEEFFKTHTLTDTIAYLFVK